MELITFILSCFGATFIITKSFLFEKFRALFDRKDKYNFWRCPLCVGFHVGNILFVIGSGMGAFSLGPLLACPLYGFIAAGTSYILSVIFTDDGVKICRDFGPQQKEH